MTTIGIDNGTTGSIGIIGPNHIRFLETPNKKSILGKAKRVIMRIDHEQLLNLFSGILKDEYVSDVKAFIERPYTGTFVNAMLPGQRAFEATLVCLEIKKIPYEVVDSKEWQKSIIGDSTKGSEALKAASLKIGASLYPNLSDVIEDHGDADGLLIARHYHEIRAAKASQPSR